MAEFPRAMLMPHPTSPCAAEKDANGKVVSREPFYIKAPGVIKDGSTSSTPVSGIDWYPTLLELCNITLPQEQAIDGVSLVPLLQGEKIKARPLFWHYPHYGNQGGEPSSIIMEGNWKLIHYHEDGRDELYNLLEDVGEQNELSSSESTRAKQMRVRLDQWLRQTNAKFPTEDPAFDASKRSVSMEADQDTAKSGPRKTACTIPESQLQTKQRLVGKLPRIN